MNKDILNKTLFAEKTQVFAVLDGALIPDLRMKLYEMEPSHICLYRGDLEADIAEIAPYLVRLNFNTVFYKLDYRGMLGQKLCAFLHCPYSQIEVRRQLRALLTVHTEEGDPLLFRFYDPRVIRPFLPTCNKEELKTFFGKITSFMVESKDKESVAKFSAQNGELRTEDTALN